jgi:two-component system response regulator FixJ
MIARKNGTVAVVDDDQGILQSLALLLESADYAVLLFTSGAQLLGSGDLRAVDCLVSDIDMPGMDGLELTRRVRVLHPGMPTILITGYPDRLKQMPRANVGNDRLIVKPFHGNELLDGIADALRGRPG